AGRSALRWRRHLPRHELSRRQRGLGQPAPRGGRSLADPRRLGGSAAGDEPDPYLRVFSANGYYDFATPFFETEYTLQHMGLDPTLEKNISFGYYPSGHMIYLHEPSLRQLKTDLARFYDQTLGR